MDERIGEYLTVTPVPVPPKRKTKIWDVKGNNGAVLGQVKWYGAWRQYTFCPWPDTIFNKGCMEDLCAFLNRENKAHRDG
jgi:hypothetical protein